MASATTEEAFNERVNDFTAFLQRDFNSNRDQTAIKSMVQQDRRRLIVSIDELRQYNRQTAQNLLRLPMDYLPAFDKALRDIVMTAYNPVKDRPMQDAQVYYVGLRGAFGEHHVNPRTLNASHLGQMVCVEGIVTRCSLVRPKVVKSVHYCERTHLFHSREYRDSTSLLGDSIPTGSAYPTEDENGNPLTTEFGYCTYRDHQMITIQEMPERAPAGQLPRSIDVVLDDDLVDQCKPGDRIQIVGVYRSVGGKNSGATTGTFRTLILANSVRLLEKEIAQPTLSETDIRNIREISKKRSVLDLLARSLAPSIYGHEWIKKALLLLLFGGMEHNLQNGTHIRGDINMLLLGDPSTAKSQFLRFVLNIAPLAIATTGRGSSGVGLTAAVTQDKETGDRRLEAGAMVLADRGIVCIDEFDKMSESDRVAIHEVMEQQTITIAKAGIHTSLNARCSVVAAANPTYGQYDENLEPHRNIRLPDSLLSRFDLLFIVLDRTDEATDRLLSNHVLRMHRYLPPGVEEGQPIPDASNSPYDILNAVNAEDNPAGDDTSPVYETRNTALYQRNNPASAAAAASGREGLSRSAKKRANREVQYLALPFLKKYIHYAKLRIKPVLTKEASDYITEAYARFRNEKAQDHGRRKTLPITARTLETLIRLSTAHAKARLSQRVEEDDAEVAVEILEFALFKEFKKKRKPRGPDAKRRRVEDGGAGDDSDSEDDHDGSDADDKPAVDSTAAARNRTSASVQAMGVDDDSSNTAAGYAESLARFRQRLDAVFQEFGGQLAMSECSDLVNRGVDDAHRFTDAVIQVHLRELEESSGIFIDRDSEMIYRV
ncbi:MCM DNA helicase complex subunit [Sorochytrium milnesiophthora]